MWKEICSCATRVLAQNCWVVGDGHIMDFLHDSWLFDLLLSMWWTYISVEVGESISISNLI